MSYTQDFINTVAPIVQKYCKAYGYKYASPIIAQACCESAWGRSWISKAPYFNFFGLKCGSSWKGRRVNAKTHEEYKKGTLTAIKADFRAYDSLDEGIKGYFDFIQYSRYANLKQATSPEDYLEKIRADGYATSYSYVNTNKSIIEKYGLKKYDEQPAIKKTDIDVIIAVIKEEYGNGAERRKRLEQAGYNASDVQDKVNKIYAYIESIL